MSGLRFQSRGRSSLPAASRAGVLASSRSGAGFSRFACGPP